MCPMHTCPCHRPWRTVPRRPGSSSRWGLLGCRVHTEHKSHAAAFFPRSGSAMFCARWRMQLSLIAGPSSYHLLQKVVRPSPPDRPLLGRWPRRSVRCPSPPPSLDVESKVAQTSARRPSEGFLHCQTMAQAALSFGRPRPISRLYNEPRWPAIQALLSTQRCAARARVTRGAGAGAGRATGGGERQRRVASAGW